MSNDLSIGIDVGGTKIAGILYDGEKILAETVLATPRDNFKHFLVMLSAVVDPLREKAEDLKKPVRGIGLGVAGALDSTGTKMVFSPNLTYLNGHKIAEKFAEKVSLPVFIDNDAKCFVVAEAMSGAGRKHKNVFGVILGTGIGGGFFEHDGIQRGRHGLAGEIGEMIIDFAKRQTFEAYYHELMSGNPADVAQRAYTGDTEAQRLYKDFGETLGTVLGNISNLIDPDIFVIGGGVAASADLYLPEAKRSLDACLQSAEAIKDVKIVPAKLLKHSGAIGAALLVK